MMKLRSILAATAALALTTTPVFAQASTAKAKKTTELSRASAKKSAKDSEVAGGTGIVIGVVAAAAIIGAIVIGADQEDDNTPVSP